MKNAFFFAASLTLIGASSFANAAASSQLSVYKCIPDSAQTDTPVGSPDSIEIFTDVDASLHTDGGAAPATLVGEVKMGNNTIRYLITGRFEGDLLLNSVTGKFIPAEDAEVGARGEFSIEEGVMKAKLWASGDVSNYAAYVCTAFDFGALIGE